MGTPVGKSRSPGGDEATGGSETSGAADQFHLHGQQHSRTAGHGGVRGGARGAKPARPPFGGVWRRRQLLQGRTGLLRPVQRHGRRGETGGGSPQSRSLPARSDPGTV